MLWNAKEGAVPLGNTEMCYVCFGSGNRHLVFLPGLSDGLATVKGKALLLAAPYRMFFQEFTVWMFSRKNELPDDYSIKDMADDQAEAMKYLGIRDAAVCGVSQGGMIAQCLAADHPELVGKLILTVTAGQVSDMARSCVSKWISLAEKGEQGELLIDTAEQSYTEKKLKSFRKMYPAYRLLPKLKDSRRFLVNAKAILAFDGGGIAERISCPVLIIGGEKDLIVGPDASRDLHERIPGSTLYMYPESGHALYEEEKDFNERICRFLKEE